MLMGPPAASAAQSIDEVLPWPIFPVLQSSHASGHTAKDLSGGSSAHSALLLAGAQRMLEGALGVTTCYCNAPVSLAVNLRNRSS